MGCGGLLRRGDLQRRISGGGGLRRCRFSFLLFLSELLFLFGDFGFALGELQLALFLGDRCFALSQFFLAGLQVVVAVLGVGRGIGSRLGRSRFSRLG